MPDFKATFAGHHFTVFISFCFVKASHESGDMNYFLGSSFVFFWMLTRLVCFEVLFAIIFPQCQATPSGRWSSHVTPLELHCF